MSRPCYSVGAPFDLRIGARANVVGYEPETGTRVEVSLVDVRLSTEQLEGLTECRKSDRKRQGRAQVGHYIRVVK